jgi:hypothetical protein
VKDGKKVAPYAQATHNDHVHVAYAKGPGNPALFGRLQEAQSFENRFKPSGAETLTTNTTELAGLLDGLFGKKAPKLKPGQKPTMGEFGTGVGEQILRRKKEQEEYLKLLRSGESFKPPSMDSSELAFGPDWMPWNWGKMVDKERKGKKNKLTNTNSQYEMMMREMYPERYKTSHISPESLQPGFGKGAVASAPMNINVPITVNQQPGEDGEALANRVATLFYEAMNNAQSASIFS